jgi:sec-independent protein translocase protein TatB
MKKMAEGAKGQLQTEIGEELDWKQLDPRKYDPRRIIREALAETPVRSPVASLNRPKSRFQPEFEKGIAAPFDSEST